MNLQQPYYKKDDYNIVATDLIRPDQLGISENIHQKKLYAIKTCF